MQHPVTPCLSGKNFHREIFQPLCLDLHCTQTPMCYVLTKEKPVTSRLLTWLIHKPNHTDLLSSVNTYPPGIPIHNGQMATSSTLAVNHATLVTPCLPGMRTSTEKMFQPLCLDNCTWTIMGYRKHLSRHVDLATISPINHLVYPFIMATLAVNHAMSCHTMSPRHVLLKTVVSSSLLDWYTKHTNVLPSVRNNHTITRIIYLAYHFTMARWQQSR